MALGGDATTPEEWRFQPTPKIATTAYRVVPPKDTLARVRGCAGRIPITRVSHLTPLDRVGLSVCSAVTPLAIDLTTHMGKGADPQHAEVSAIMEAIERVSAERTDQPTISATLAELASTGRSVLDPRMFDLPDDTRFTDGCRVSWVEGWDLVQDQPVWIARDLVITPPSEGILTAADTNGLASGNTYLEAVFHGLCEVIERDSLGLRLFCASVLDADEQPLDQGRIIPETLPVNARAALSKIIDAGLYVTTEVLPSEFGIPVFRSLLFDPEFESADGRAPRTFAGFGAAPDAAVAAVRSITEAAQSRLALIQGARDSFNVLGAPWRRSSSRSPLRIREARHCIPFSSVTTFTSGDLLDDVRHLIDRLSNGGVDHVVVSTLTRRDWGIPVVRVRVPGFSAFAVNRNRVGWRCQRYLL